MSISVLVIDDQPLEGEMIAHVLRQHRPDALYVGQALNGAEGIRMAEAHTPDLIFLDIRMPGMDGLTAIPLLRQASPASQVVMISAFDDFDFLRGALRAGAKDYLLKPVRPADILGALDLTAPAPEPPSVTAAPAASRTAHLAQAIRRGDRAEAEKQADRFLSSFVVVDQANIMHVCVRCMEFAAELAQGGEAGSAPEGLSFLYQDFVHRVSTLRDPALLKTHFLTFAGEAADLCGHTAGDLGHRQIAEAKRYIAEHYHEPLQLAEVAKTLYLSTAYFSRLFKEKTGETFSDYLAGCRIERARQLLSTTDLSIAEVSAAIGYQEANSFSRLFKTRTGQSPSDYRAARKK